jgi:hypothetical protein
MTPAAVVVTSGGLQFGQDVLAADVVPVEPARVLSHGVDQVVDLVGSPDPELDATRVAGHPVTRHPPAEPAR